MAGKTLPGIGDEDESGEREGTPAGGTPVDTAVPARSTDRMPMYSGPTVIDEDKVAEGLKKLRSLDEPLGPVTSAVGSGMPTLKEGSAVGYKPTPVTPPAPSALELLRSHGTAHGHALSTPAIGQGLVPMTVDDRMKGTLLGHSLHLPDLPEVVEENRSAEVRPVERVAPSGALTPGAMNSDFSHGDAHFFQSEPVNTEFEPEHPKANLMRRGVIFVAIMAIFVVAAIAYVGVGKPEGTPSVPVETQAAPATHPPEALPPTSTVPSSAAVLENAAATGTAIPAASAATPTPGAATPAAVPAPAEVPEPVEELKPDPAAAALKAESPSAKLQREAAEAEAIKAAKAASRSTFVRPSRSSRSSSPSSPSSPSTPSGARAGRQPPTANPAPPKPVPTGKRAKVEEDPDGTLPLSD